MNQKIEKLKLYNKNIQNSSASISELLEAWSDSKAENILELVQKIRESCDLIVFDLNNSVADEDANLAEPEKNGKEESGEEQQILAELNEKSKMSEEMPAAGARHPQGLRLNKHSLTQLESTISKLLDAKLSQLLPQPQTTSRNQTAPQEGPGETQQATEPVAPNLKQYQHKSTSFHSIGVEKASFKE